MELFLILILLHGAHSVNHSLKHFATASTGVQGLPEFMVVTVIDGVQLAYCDTNSNTEIPEDWVTETSGDDPKLWEWNNHTCPLKYSVLKSLIKEIQGRSSQAGGVHILQEVSGCTVDDDMKVIDAFDRFSYNREDLMTLDMNRGTWNYAKEGKPLDNQPAFINNMFLAACPLLLTEYLQQGKGSVHGEVPPLVSLLQKSSSSQVSCYATGFYTTGVQMFWRKDGEEIHEGVTQGEILPSHNRQFQMSVDLDVSSVKYEDWSRYDCVVQLSGTKDDIITKLDQAWFRTNCKKDTNKIIAIVLGVLLVLGIAAFVGFMVYKKKVSESSSELLERLTADV